MNLPNNSQNMFHMALPLGVFGINRKNLSKQLSERNVPHSPLDSVDYTAISDELNMLRFNQSWQRVAYNPLPTFVRPSLRRQEKDVLKELLLWPGHVIQVCGAPLVGKSFFVKETIRDLKCQSGGHTLIEHHICCKGSTSFASVLIKLFHELHIEESPNTQAPILQLKAALSSWLSFHHIFVFHKCEAFKTHQGQATLFTDFLQELSQLPDSTVVFTSYKRFLRQSDLHTLQIGMLHNISDIQALLNFYSGINTLEPGYACLILRYNLCFPHAIRHFVQVYLQGNVIPTPEEIEESLQRVSVTFLEDCLSHRLEELPNWLHFEKLKWIVLFCLSLEGTFTEELLWEMINKEHNHDARWSEIRTHLEENFALCQDPGQEQRLRFHPLVLLYFFNAFHSRKLILRGDWFDQSCNKIVKFLCGILDKTEMVSRCHGNKFAVFQCLLPEWTNMKNTIHMAIYRQNYKVYWKVATSAANILIKWSTKEAIDFFQAMYDSSRLDGHHSQKETAFLEGCLAYAISQGKSTSLDGSAWKKATQHFHSSLDVLKKEDCSFYTAQILCYFAHMLSRQGEYKKSEKFFLDCQRLMIKSLGEDEEVRFSVTDWRREELSVTIKILSTIPQIFLGKNVEALRCLHVIMKDMEDNNLYHAEYSTVLNLMGLAVQRGNGNLDRAVFYYRHSLEERMHLINICPQDLVVPYNNLSMLLAERGQMEKALQNLHSALAIRQQHGWNSYYTALTLMHLGDMYLKWDDLVTSLKYYCQADQIFSVTSKNHDIRLRLKLNLAHVSLAIEQKCFEIKNGSSVTCHCNNGEPVVKPGIERTYGISSQPGICICKETLLQASDKEKSAKKYLKQVGSLVRHSMVTLSDHGHCQLISSLAHLILIEWGNDQEFVKYRERLRDIMTTHTWVVQELNKPEGERNTLINLHSQFFEEISTNDPPNLQVESAIELLITNCEFCALRENYFGVSAWQSRISLFQKKRQDFLSQFSFPLNYDNSSLPFSSQEDQNSADLYMTFGAASYISEGSDFNNSSHLYINLGNDSDRVDDFEDSSIVRNCLDAMVDLTDRKVCVVIDCTSSETGIPNHRDKGKDQAASCLCSKDSLKCCSEFHQCQNHSFEEVSWNGSELIASSFNADANQCESKPSDILESAAPKNNPTNFSIIESSLRNQSILPSENQQHSISNNTNCLDNTTGENLVQDLIRTFAMTDPELSGGVSDNVSTSPCDDNNVLCFEKSTHSNNAFSSSASPSNSRSSISALAQLEAVCHENIPSRCKRALAESGYSSDIISTANVSRYLPLVNRSFRHEHSFTSSEEDGLNIDSGYRINDVRALGYDALYQANSKAEVHGVDCNVLSQGLIDRMDGFSNGNLREKKVIPSLVSNHFENLSDHNENVVREEFSQMTFSDRTPVSANQTSRRKQKFSCSNVRKESDKLCIPGNRKTPSEQDERDVK